MDNWNTINSIINQTAHIQKIASSIHTPEAIRAQETLISAVANYSALEVIAQPKNFLNAYFNATSYYNAHTTYEMVQNISGALQALSVHTMYVANISLSDNEEEIEQEDVKLANEKIVSEILLPDSKKNIDISNAAIIKLSPINDNVLCHLAENPRELYSLSSGDFEEVMARIYSKLGYDVERTKATRDGGKDLIIRKREILGDFVYYVECKKYSSSRPIGVGIVRELVGTITTDKVNGGILATTSFFSPDAIKFVTDNNFNYQIQMQDYEYIQNLLKKVN